MIDLFTPLHISDSGTLAIDYANDASVVGPDLPPRPQRFDVTGPTAPPRIDIGVYVSGPNLPNPPAKMGSLEMVFVSVVGPNDPPRPK